MVVVKQEIGLDPMRLDSNLTKQSLCHLDSHRGPPSAINRLEANIAVFDGEYWMGFINWRWVESVECRNQNL